MADKTLVTLVVLVVAITCWCGPSSSSVDPFCARADTGGTCNLATFESDNPAETQANVMSDYKTSLGTHGVVSGCYRVHTFMKDNSRVPVYLYFSCSQRSEDKCMNCYYVATMKLKYGCGGRAGGIVSLDYCCLRYELYNICGLD